MKRQVNAKSLANLKPIKKGEIRNPRGSNNPELTRLRKMTAFEIQELISVLFRKSEKEIRLIEKNKEEGAFRRWICKMVLVGMETADEKRMTLLLDRMVGKVSDKIQVFGPDEKPDVENLTEAEEVELAKRCLKGIELTDDE